MDATRLLLVFAIGLLGAAGATALLPGLMAPRWPDPPMGALLFAVAGALVLLRGRRPDDLNG